MQKVTEGTSDRPTQYQFRTSNKSRKRQNATRIENATDTDRRKEKHIQVKQPEDPSH